jgi:protein-S-isoprenylcysteine O-methyltransferase Ste14
MGFISLVEILTFCHTMFLMFGFLLIFPSIFLLIPYVFLVLLFHQMILEEESYIENMHGEEYLNYKRKVKRYITVANS